MGLPIILFYLTDLNNIFPSFPRTPARPTLGPDHSASQNVTGTSRATSPPSEPQTSQDEVSKRILFHALTLRDLYMILQQRQTSCPSTVNTRTGIFRS